jgi:putative flippase GtrA
MNKNDILFSIIAGLMVAWVGIDFLGTKFWFLLVVLPVLAVLGFLLCDIISKKMAFVGQAGRFGLIGAFADVIDIKVYQLLFFLLPISLPWKAVSFIVATVIKYFLNKHWAFQKHEGVGQGREVLVFFIFTCVGLLINIASFSYFVKITTGIPETMWTELCIIFAALVAAVWNFIGYKFFVFKK